MAEATFDRSMPLPLGRHWSALMLRGALAILFGVLAILVPGAALATLALLFGAYALIDGVIGIFAGVRAARAHQRWGWLVAEGVLGIGAGLTALLLPGIAVYAFVLLAGSWGILSGATMVIAAFGLEKAHGRWAMGLAGLFSVAWGILFLMFPWSGAFVLAMWIAAYALVFGVLLCVLALRLRQATR